MVFGIRTAFAFRNPDLFLFKMLVLLFLYLICVIYTDLCFANLCLVFLICVFLICVIYTDLCFADLCFVFLICVLLICVQLICVCERRICVFQKHKSQNLKPKGTPKIVRAGKHKAGFCRNTALWVFRRPWVLNLEIPRSDVSDLLPTRRGGYAMHCCQLIRVRPDAIDSKYKAQVFNRSHA